jgi:hypothetical protein
MANTNRKAGLTALLDARQLASTRRVNEGRDTKLVLHDGSTIVMMGVADADAMFAPPPDQNRRQLAAR